MNHTSDTNTAGPADDTGTTRSANWTTTPDLLTTPLAIGEPVAISLGSGQHYMVDYQSRIFGIVATLARVANLTHYMGDLFWDARCIDVACRGGRTKPLEFTYWADQAGTCMVMDPDDTTDNFKPRGKNAWRVVVTIDERQQCWAWVERIH